MQPIITLCPFRIHRGASRFAARATLRTALAAMLAATLLAGCPAPTQPEGPATKAGEQITCTGKVLGPDDKPVADATVTAYKAVRKYFDTQSRYQPIATIKSKADGSFSFGAPADEQSVTVLAEKLGLAIGWASLDLRKGETEAAIKLGKALMLSGTVTDKSGKPIQAARVTLTLRPADRGGGAWLTVGGAIESLVATTGADGRFSFANVPAGYAGEFRAEADGRGTLVTLQQRRGRGYPAPMADIKLTLPPAAVIEVVAVDKATGKGVGDVTLMAADYRVLPTEFGRCVSKKQGRYRWDRLPAGRYQVGVAQPLDRPAEWAAKPVIAAIKAGEARTDIRIELVRGGVAELAFKDAEEGTPVQHVNFGLYSKQEKIWVITGTGEDGVGRVRLVPGEYEISWVAAQRYPHTRNAGTLTVEAGKTIRQEVELRKSPRLHGVVRDPAGRTVSGAFVCVLPGWRSTDSDREGKYELWPDFRRWPHRGSFLLLFRHAGRNLAAAVEVSKPGERVDPKLQPALTIRGRVTDPAGEPLRRADVSVLLGQAGTRPGPLEAVTATDAAGRYEVKALPGGRRYGLRFEAEGYSTAEVFVDCGGSQAGRVEAATVVLPRVNTAAAPPAVENIPVPDIPGGWAIWGASGRDDRGHIWFGVSSHKTETPSAHLFEYDPATGKVTDRGDVVSQLKATGVHRDGEQQMKIHSKMFQVGEHLYFCSMDEKDEDMAAEKLPTWGGHLWRLRLKDYKWEHLKTFKEPAIAMAAGGHYVYALCYFGHVLYQFDVDTGRTRSVKVGAIGGHVSRNLFCDRRGHVYLPRIRPADRGGPKVTLVEYDASLKEISEAPLKYYLNGRPLSAHGITGFAALPDGSTAFITHNGWLSLLTPSPDGPAKLTDLGWFHPNGPEYAASLFADPSGRYLMGPVRGGWERGYDWVTYDLRTRTHAVAPMQATRVGGLDLNRISMYGCQTRDDAGACYVVGVHGGQRNVDDDRPILLKVIPPKPPARNR